MEGKNVSENLKDEIERLMVYYCLQDGGQVGRNSWQRQCHFWYRPPQQELGLEWEGPCAHPLSSSAELHSVHGMGKSCSHSDLLPHLPEPLRYKLYTTKRSLPKVREVQNKSRSAETWVIQSMPLRSQVGKGSGSLPFGGIALFWIYQFSTNILFLLQHRMLSRIDITLH